MTAHQPCLSISTHHLCALTCELICGQRGSITSMPSETPDARSDSTLIVDTGSRHTPPAQSPRLTRCRISIYPRQECIPLIKDTASACAGVADEVSGSSRGTHRSETSHKSPHHSIVRL